MDGLMDNDQGHGRMDGERRGQGPGAWSDGCSQVWTKCGQRRMQAWTKTNTWRHELANTQTLHTRHRQLPQVVAEPLQRCAEARLRNGALLRLLLLRSAANQ